MATVDVDWKRIKQTHQKMGEWPGLLLFQPDRPVTSDELDEITIDDDAEEPPNGGWFETPKGWMLFYEADSRELETWLQVVIDRLTAANRDGKITAPTAAALPKWAQNVNAVRRAANFCFNQPISGRTEPLLDWVTNTAINWLAEPPRRIRSEISLRFEFWASPAIARQTWLSEINRRHPVAASSLDDTNEESRFTSATSWEPVLSLTSERAPEKPWQDCIEDLRTQLCSAPLDFLSLAYLGDSHHKMDNHYSSRRWFSRPDCWADYLHDAHGIQIITTSHLEKTNDLTNWHTTKLGPNHYLVQAKDLEPWLRDPSDIPPEALHTARTDFGQAILRPDAAEQLGLNKKLPRPEIPTPRARFPFRR